VAEAVNEAFKLSGKKLSVGNKKKHWREKTEFEKYGKVAIFGDVEGPGTDVMIFFNRGKIWQNNRLF
jgi:hypothetical protein